MSDPKPAIIDGTHDDDAEPKPKPKYVARVVLRDGDRALKFAGDLIASVDSSEERGDPDFSGETGRWAEHLLYRTKGGKYVCEIVRHTRWQGDHTRYSGAVCANEAEVIAFFGQTRFAQRLYAEAGIDNTETVE